MPYYEILTPDGTLSEAQRTAVANDITDIHCDETGAPRWFVHVHYKDYPRDRQYTAGKPDNSLVIIMCNIRAGRSLVERQRLVTRISARVSTTLDRPESELMLTINELNASTAMEFGLILPQPGGEAEWFERNRETLRKFAVQSL